MSWPGVRWRCWPHVPGIRAAVKGRMKLLCGRAGGGLGTDLPQPLLLPCLADVLASAASADSAGSDPRRRWTQPPARARPSASSGRRERPADAATTSTFSTGWPPASGGLPGLLVRVFGRVQRAVGSGPGPPARPTLVVGEHAHVVACVADGARGSWPGSGGRCGESSISGWLRPQHIDGAAAAVS